MKTEQADNEPEQTQRERGVKASSLEQVEFDPASSEDRAAMLVAKLITTENRAAGEVSDEEREEITKKWLKWMTDAFVAYLDWSKIEGAAAEELRTRGMEGRPRPSCAT